MLMPSTLTTPLSLPILPMLSLNPSFLAPHLSIVTGPAPSLSLGILTACAAPRPGPMVSPYWLLRLGAPYIAEPFSPFRLSLQSSDAPSQCKLSCITPVPKVPQPLVCQDYRPISLTSIRLSPGLWRG